MTKPSEPWKVSEARIRRAGALAMAVLEWQRLAAVRRYPRSLQDILLTALKREYRLGSRASA